MDFMGTNKAGEQIKPGLRKDRPLEVRTKLGLKRQAGI